MGNFLTEEQRLGLKLIHRAEDKRRYADRIKAVLAWDSGWRLEDISELLLLDEKTIRNYRKWYEEGGIDRLCSDEFSGSQCRLSDEVLEELRVHLGDAVYATTSEIIEYVRQRYGVVYSVSGMTDLLHRLGFVYKKTKLVPGKADANEQRAFLDKLEELKSSKGARDKIYYLDGVHPQHNSQAGYGWILKGVTKELKSNTGRRRINLNGALDADTHEVIIREDDSINADSTLALLQALEVRNPTAEVIYVVADNASYYRNKRVTEYLETSKIEILFLPPYAPNLNLIERLWKFFKKKIIYNRYYPTFEEFKKACSDFFVRLNSKNFEGALDSLLATNFQIIQP